MAEPDPYLAAARRFVHGSKPQPEAEPGATKEPPAWELRTAHFDRDVADLWRAVEEIETAHNKLRRAAIISDALLAIGGLALAWLVVFGG